MKFLLFVDKIYSKIQTFFLLLVIPITALSIYLYMKLPSMIPTKFGFDFKPTSWGYKSSIFIFPIVLLILPLFTSKKIVSSQEKLLTRRVSAEVIIIVVLVILILSMIGVYSYYFKMI
ncbi:DUF1648 domain-containing protein [Lactococcus lactis]|uniref:DUF1648 domain-containing protein n=1 Tax=Lactococcus lactis TaxID=1358 RepID=UPI001D19036E|nr:DUF1648 domain-containing protein [Lactococcus lactis]MCC4120940.1 DUF1648 domain-containing protein [Lactococcus lactis]